METTRLSVTEKPVDTFESDLAVYFAIRQKDQPPSCDPAVKPRWKTPLP
jgi:leucyl aminopeptidase